MKRPSLLVRSLLFGTLCALLAGVLHRWGLGLWLIGLVVVVFAAVGNLLPWVGVRWIDALIQALRAWHWRAESGRHHAFDGTALTIDDDGRHVWMTAEDLRRVMRRREPLDVTAARHSQRWRRDADDVVWLRVDAVVEQLARDRDAYDPRLLRLRLYLERSVLFPASERRRRRG